jgi:acyl-CoA reductase-like NAD-dependent aldehyde dehydrogenase
MGPLILPREVDRVAAWVAEARDAGGTIAAGGARINDRVYAPTVIVKPPATLRVSPEEVFGPVTCIYPYADLDQAIAQANSLPFAFQASVFARGIGVAMQAAQSLDASTILINDHTAFRADWMPFAGRRQSGYGVGGIRQASDATLLSFQDLGSSSIARLRETLGPAPSRAFKPQGKKPT